MTKELDELLKIARNFSFSDSDAEIQRRSFAYGNAHLENKNVTRKIIDKAADKLAKRNESKN